MLSNLKWINVALRGLMELGFVISLGYWGIKTGSTTLMKILLGIGTPLLGFGFWGLVDFRQAGTMAEPLRLFQELALTAIAALALYLAGAVPWAWGLAILSIFHHGLVYATGQTLLKQ